MNDSFSGYLFDDQIVSKSSKKNERRVWSKAEADFILRNMFRLRPSEIANRIGRSEQAINSRLRNIRRAAYGGIVTAKRRGI